MLALPVAGCGRPRVDSWRSDAGLEPCASVGKFSADVEDIPGGSAPVEFAKLKAVAGVKPVPDNAIVADSISPTLSVAVRRPDDKGVNVTVILQLFREGRVFGLGGQSLFAEKSAAAGPLIVTLLMASGPDQLFFNVAVIATLDCLKTWLPKDNVEGASGVWARTRLTQKERKDRTWTATRKCFPKRIAGADWKPLRIVEISMPAPVFTWCSLLQARGGWL